MRSFRPGPRGAGWMLLVAALAAATPAHAGPGETPGWTAQADGLLGFKFVHSGDWAGYGTHQSIGGRFAVGRRSWPALFAAEVLFSARSKSEYDSARGGDVIVQTLDRKSVV